MKSKLLFSIFLTLTGLLYAGENYRITGYLAVWKWEEHRWSPEAVEGNLLTDVNLSFALIKNERELYMENYDENKLSNLFSGVRKLKERYPGLRVNLSVGGWGADGFSDMAYYPENRASFVKSVVNWIRKYDLDGVDIDWEYPVDGGGGIIKSRPEDRENFTLLMKDLRSSLNRLSSVTGKKYTLSFAAGAFEEYLQWIEPRKLAGVVDFVNLMAYDFYGEWTDITGHHANLKLSPYDPYGRSAERAVNLFLEAGFPARKIVLGVPFYGRGWGGVSSKNNGLYQPYREAISNEINYSKIREFQAKNGMKKFWDSTAQAPYMYDGDLWISYESPRSLKLKIKFVKSRGLGGIMFWEYFLDPTGELLKTIFQVLCPEKAMKDKFIHLNHPR